MKWEIKIKCKSKHATSLYTAKTYRIAAAIVLNEHVELILIKVSRSGWEMSGGQVEDVSR